MFSTKKNLRFQENFPQTRKFSINKKGFHQKKIHLFKENIHKQGSFPQTNTFTQSKSFSENKDQKRSLKAKILDLCYSIADSITKSYAKIFNAVCL